MATSLVSVRTYRGKPAFVALGVTRSGGNLLADAVHTREPIPPGALACELVVTESRTNERVTVALPALPDTRQIILPPQNQKHIILSILEETPHAQSPD